MYKIWNHNWKRCFCRWNLPHLKSWRMKELKLNNNLKNKPRTSVSKHTINRRQSPAFKRSFTVFSKCNKNVSNTPQWSQSRWEQREKRENSQKSQTRRKEKTKQRNRATHVTVCCGYNGIIFKHFTFAFPEKQKKKKDITTKKDEQAEQQTTEENRQEVTRVLYSERSVMNELQPVHTFNISWRCGVIICPVLGFMRMWISSRGHLTDLERTHQDQISTFHRFISPSHCHYCNANWIYYFNCIYTH